MIWQKSRGCYSSPGASGLDPYLFEGVGADTVLTGTPVGPSGSHVRHQERVYVCKHTLVFEPPVRIELF
jgi:hypothetical protein